MTARSLGWACRLPATNDPGDPDHGKPRQKNPHDDDGHPGTDADRPLTGLLYGALTTLRHHISWHEPNRERDTERDEDQVVEIAEHGDEVRDQIDRAQRVGDDRTREQFGVPGSARVARHHVNRAGVRFEDGRALLEIAE